MAWTTPATATAGSTALTAAFWNTQVRDQFTELAPFFNTWTSYTPTVAQGVSTNIAKTVNYSKYFQIGKFVFWNFSVTLTAGGTGGTAVTLSLPKTSASSLIPLGHGFVFDGSTNTPYSGFLFAASTGIIRFAGDWSGQDGWGAIPNIAAATSDTFAGICTYEAA